MATYALDVIARIEKYQRRFAEIPGFTDKEAAKAASAFEKRMVAAQEKVAQAAAMATRQAAQEQVKAARIQAAEQKKAAAEALAAQEALNDKIQRLAAEVERVQVGDDWFNAKKQVAELDALETELRQLGQLTTEVQGNIDARKWQILGGLGQKVEASAAKAGQGLGKMGRGLNAVGSQIPDVLSQLQSGTPLFTIFAQQGLQVVQMLNLQVSSLARLKLALGPLALAIGGAVLAYKEYEKETARLNRIQELSAKTAATLKERNDKLKDTAIDLKVAVGELSEKEGELLKIRRAAFIEQLPAMQELTKAITEQSLRVKEAQEVTAKGAEGTTDAVAKAYMGMSAVQERTTGVLEREQKVLADLEKQRSDLVGSLRSQVEADIALINAEEEATEKEERRAEALRKLTEEQEALKAAGDRWRDAIQDAEGTMQRHYRLLAEIIDLEKKGALTAQEAAGARLVVHQQTQKAIADEKKAEQDLARERAERAEQARQTVENATQHRLSAVERVKLEEKRALEELQRNDQATQEQIFALRQEYGQRRIEAAREEARQIAEQMREELATSLQMAGDLFGNVFSLAMEAADFDGQIARQGEAVSKLQQKLKDGEETLSKAQKKVIREQIKARKEAARSAFEAKQRASKAEAIMNGILAASYALTLGPVAGPIYAATAATAAATQVTAIENMDPPKLHTGTGSARAPRGRRPDEFMALLQDEEGILTRPAVDRLGGPGAVDALNRGAPMMPPAIIVQHRYKHRILDEVLQDHLQQPTGLRRATASQTNRGRTSPYRSS